MSKKYRIVFECYDSSQNTQHVLSKTVIMEGSIKKPEDLFDFGFSHEQQVKLLHSCQDSLLKEQITSIESVVESCPHCADRKLIKYGKRRSDYHDVFTDHKLTIGRKRCPDCGYEPSSTIKTILGESMSPDLIRLQTELGANHTYRESQEIFSIFSRSKRYINNHDRIKHTAEKVGNQIKALHQTESIVLSSEIAEELIINIDGGHINTTEEGKKVLKQ